MVESDDKILSEKGKGLNCGNNKCNKCIYILLFKWESPYFSTKIVQTNFLKSLNYTNQISNQ